MGPPSFFCPSSANPSNELHSHPSKKRRGVRWSRVMWLAWWGNRQTHILQKGGTDGGWEVYDLRWAGRAIWCAQLELSSLLRWVVAFKFKLTSLSWGEGLIDGWLGVVEGEIGSEDEGGGGGMGGERMKLNHDGVDLQLKLRLPT